MPGACVAHAYSDSQFVRSFMPVRWKNKNKVAKMMVTRNLFTCEAHHELVTITWRIFEDRREDAAKQYLLRLETLCHGEIPAI